jgi:hypothetical protein
MIVGEWLASEGIFESDERASCTLQALEVSVDHLVGRGNGEAGGRGTIDGGTGFPVEEEEALVVTVVNVRDIDRPSMLAPYKLRLRREGTAATLAMAS